MHLSIGLAMYVLFKINICVHVIYLKINSCCSLKWHLSSLGGFPHPHLPLFTTLSKITSGCFYCAHFQWKQVIVWMRV